MLNLVRVGVFSAALGFSFLASAQTVGFATLPPGSILHAQASVIAKVVQDNTKLRCASSATAATRRSSMR